MEWGLLIAFVVFLLIVAAIADALHVAFELILGVIIGLFLLGLLIWWLVTKYSEHHPSHPNISASTPTSSSQAPTETSQTHPNPVRSKPMVHEERISQPWGDSKPIVGSSQKYSLDSFDEIKKIEYHELCPFVSSDVLKSMVARESTFDKGMDYFQYNYVGRVEKKGDTFSGLVKSHDESAYFVTVKVANGQIVSHACNCQAHAKYSGPCKHVIALVLKANTGDFTNDDGR
jgi:Uncharacterized conserved protein